jgi:hypothetical protein
VGKETLREIAATFNVGQMVIHRLATKHRGTVLA